MRMVDLILKKKSGDALTDDELHFWVQGVTDKSIPLYQTSALLMAICFQGLSPHETAVLTEEMLKSGEEADLSAIDGVTVDKHSTGGVGDKTTLVVAPLAAACGLTVAKMSGRGLGHTGGTVDKLESIPGFQTVLEKDRFVDIVKEHGLCVIAQSGNIAPADKELYALRDVTGTVDNVSLIASSIMSKKLASGASTLCLDVKVGSGAFMTTVDDAVALAKAMVDIGTHHGRSVSALITDMDRPLGLAVGNALEVKEAIETLKGHGPDDLTALSLSIVATLLQTTSGSDYDTCFATAKAKLDSGEALEKLRAMIGAQGGDPAVVDDPSLLPDAAYSRVLTADKDGYITAMDTQSIGTTCTVLGAGRAKVGDVIDMGAGMVFYKKTGDAVKAGDAIATLYTNDEARLADALVSAKQSITIGDTPPAPRPLIFASVDKNGVRYY
ncbi:MAG: thymidine phosphorylase [Clostridia bacterium]|nr:thymidine phosphorylase [Clostridia bacterium]